MLECNTEIP